jgi:hypothetical protein
MPGSPGTLEPASAADQKSAAELASCAGNGADTGAGGIRPIDLFSSQLISRSQQEALALELAQLASAASHARLSQPTRRLPPAAGESLLSCVSSASTPLLRAARCCLLGGAI